MIVQTQKLLNHLIPFRINKEFIMTKRIPAFYSFLALVILGSLVLSGCGTIHPTAGVIPIVQPDFEPETNLPPVLGPEAAREAALIFLQTTYGSYAPGSDLNWENKNDQSNLVGASHFTYVNEEWEFSVSAPVVAPEETIYSVSINQVSSRFLWEGLVDAYGQVVTTKLVFNNASSTKETTQVEPVPAVEPMLAEIEPEPVIVSEEQPAEEPTQATDQESCNAVKFIADITLPDGTKLLPNASFEKVWRLKNTGSCTWNKKYDLVFVDGVALQATRQVSLPTKVKPGEVVDLQVAMVSPNFPGEYYGFWMLRSTDGEIFGLGEDADIPFWVNILVEDPSSSTPPPEKITTWEGYIWSTEKSAQFDDYFERTDLGQSLYFGIESMDAKIQAQIRQLQDSGVRVRLEGTLFSNVIDYNGSQISVTLLEVLG
jgi:hypothetical protein